MIVINKKFDCRLGLSGHAGGLTCLRLSCPPAEETDPAGSANLLAEAARQLQLYFNGNLHQFTLPLDLTGTPFQLAVWKELGQIPYGTTVCYQTIAERIGRPRAVRAVGQAIHRNPLPIIIPCHRVIAKDGSLRGFAWGLDWKQRLLNLEMAPCHQDANTPSA